LGAAQAVAVGADLTYAPGIVLKSCTSPQAYQLQAQLGAGSFGEVWRCTQCFAGGAPSRQQQPEFAVKIVKASNAATVADEVRKHRLAVDLAGAVHIPDLFEDSLADVVGRSCPQPYIIVMQHIDGSAVNRLPRPEDVGHRERLAGIVVHDTLSALRRLHDCRFIHCDVKPANILVNRAGECYLCDFGVSLWMDELQLQPGEGMATAGSPLYMAPEIVKTVPALYDEKVDIWSLGVVAFELDLGYTPLSQLCGHIVSNEQVFSKLQVMATPVFESSLSMGYNNLVKSCLRIDPAQRPSSHQLAETRALSVRKADRLSLAEWLNL